MYILPCYDGGKSFNNKAQVVSASRGEHVLRSSETYVACVDKRGNFSRLWKGTGETVLRHVNSFRIDRKLKPISKKEWDAMPVQDADFLTL